MKTSNDTLSGVDDSWGELQIGNSYSVKYTRSASSFDLKHTGCGLKRQDDESLTHGANCPLWTFVEIIELF